ncbi:hypothetical protein GCM10009111_33230 [Colwellia asteriadis]|uniref:Ankyrin repeat domain-containing protein n=1 Tax=Colwellia asteriadis TaxID=517723 RepID=A0ABN1LBI5_9GAMM
MKNYWVKVLLCCIGYISYIVNVHSSSFSLEHTSKNPKAPSYAGNYLSQEQLIERFNWGYSKKLDWNKDQSLYARLQTRGFDTALLDSWVQLGWLNHTAAIDLGLYLLKHNNTDKALNLLAQVDFSTLGDVIKLDIVLTLLTSHPEKLTDSFIEHLKIGIKPVERSDFETYSMDHIYLSWMLYQASELFTLEGMALLKRLFQKNNKLLRITKNTGYDLSLNAAKWWYEQNKHQANLKETLTQQRNMQLLKHLATLNVLQLTPKELENINTALSLQPKLKDLDASLPTVIDGNIEPLNQFILALHLGYPYPEKVIENIDINLLSDAAIQHLFSWAVSVDHQILVKKLFTTDKVYLLEAKRKLWTLLQITAAPLSWYNGFMAEQVTSFANEMLQSECKRSEPIKANYFLEAIDFTTLNDSAIVCIFSLTLNSDVHSKAWSQVNNLTANQQVWVYKKLINNNLFSLASLAADGVITLDNDTLFKALVHKDMFYQLSHHSQLFLLMGVSDIQLRDLIAVHIQGNEQEQQANFKMLITRHNPLSAMFVGDSWFQAKVCQLLITVQDSDTFTAAQKTLTNNTLKCPVAALDSTLANNSINWDNIEKAEHLLSPASQRALLFNSLESRSYFYLLNYIDAQTINSLLIKNSANESLLTLVKKHVEEDSTAATLFLPYIRQFEPNYNSTYRKSTAKDNLWQAAKNLVRSAEVSPFKQALHAYPYSTETIHNLLKSFSYEANLNVRAIAFSAIAEHPNFTGYVNNWALYNYLFSSNTSGSAEDLLNIYQKNGFRINELAELPQGVYFSCKELVQYLNHGLPKDIKTVDGKTLFESSVNAAMTPECLAKLDKLAVNTKTVSDNVSVYQAYLSGFPRKERSDHKRIISMFQQFKSKGFKVSSDVKTNNRLIETTANFPPQVLGFLLDNGIDINDAANIKQPPIAHIIKSSNIELLKYAVSRGAKLNVNYQNQPLLFLATRSSEITEWMLSNGYPACIKDKQGKTAYQKTYNRKIKKVLALHGGDQCH